MSFSCLASVGFAALGAAAASIVSEAYNTSNGALKDYKKITDIAMKALKNSIVGGGVIALGIATEKGIKHMYNSIPEGTTSAILNFFARNIEAGWNFTKNLTMGVAEDYSQLPFTAQIGIPLAILIACVSYIALPRLIACMQTLKSACEAEAIDYEAIDPDMPDLDPNMPDLDPNMPDLELVKT